MNPDNQAMATRPHDKLKWYRRELKASTFDLLMSLPSAVAVFIVAFVPIVILVVISFYKINIIDPAKYVGLYNYKFTFNEDPLFWHAVKLSFIYMFCSVSISFVLGLIVALALNRKVLFPGFFRGIVLLPWAMPIVVSAFIWSWLFDGEIGVINDALMKLGVISTPISFLGSYDWALPSVILSDIWIRIPLMIVVLLAALQTIPEELVEASKIDGANSWQSFRFVSWPFLLPSVFFLLLVSSIFAFRTFALGYLMTRGGPGDATYLLVIYIFDTTYEFFQIGRGAAVAMTMFFFVGLIFLFWTTIFKASLKKES